MSGVWARGVWAVLGVALSIGGCAARFNLTPAVLVTRDSNSFVAAVTQLLQSGDISDQAVVERLIAAKLELSRSQPTLFGQVRFYRPVAPGSLAAAGRVVWERIELEVVPLRPTRVASLELRDLPSVLCITEEMATQRWSEFAVNDSGRAVTIYSGPGQEGEFYVRFSKGTGERCFADVAFVQNSNR